MTSQHGDRLNIRAYTLVGGRGSYYLKTLILGLFALVLMTGALMQYFATQAEAAPSTLNFQARLKTSGGATVPDGLYNIEFKIYDSESAGASGQGVCSLNSTTDDCWWRETRTAGNAVQVRGGYMSVNLGSVTAFGNVPWNNDLWLTMNIGGVGSPVWDGEMSPRIKLTAVPYAFASDTLDGIDSSGFAQLSPATSQVVNSALAALSIDQQGSGQLLDLKAGGSTVFAVDNGGNTTISGGITLGDSTGTVAGTIRWTGTDFEGYDGSSWVSLTATGGGGGGGGSALTTLNKTANETVTGSAALQDDDQLLFAIGANESWAFRFVVQANAATQPDFQFAVSAPSGATCTVGFIDHQTAFSNSNVGCNVSSGLMTGTGADEVYEITGTIINGANPGNVRLRWAQNSSNGAVNTVYAGSYVQASQVVGASQYFVNGGNSFGADASIGTTDAFGLDILTNGSVALSFDSAGAATFNDQTTFSNGLVITSGSASIVGGIDNNSGGITNAGSITGVGANITASGALTITTSAGGALTLDSASNELVLSDATLKRIASGTTTLNLQDAADTTFSVQNSDATAVANMIVEGNLTALSFSGSGASLTNLDAGALSSGTLDDARLSNNVALLDTDQSYSGVATFTNGIVIGDSTSTAAGALRWTGLDFEGFDGSSWISLTDTGGGGGGGSPSPALTTVQKSANETVNNSSTLQDDNHLLFAVGANEEWSFRFVVQASSSAVAGIKFAVTAPSGATCQIGFIDQQTAASQSNIGCGVSSITLTGTGSNEIYEIVGSITNGSTAGNVTLRWAQGSAENSNTVVYAGSFLNASIEGGGLQFMQGGNSFGSPAILGTLDNNSLSFVTNGATALSISASGDTTLTGLASLNGGVNIGNNAADGFTITSSAVSLVNGLNFDSNTLVIDSVNNRVGVSSATPANKLNINDLAAADATAQVAVSTALSTNKGLIVQGVASQSANLFEAQNNSGQGLLVINSAGQLGLGVGSSSNGTILFNNSSNTNQISLVSGVATAPRTITLPDENGTLCVRSSLNCGFVLFANTSAQADSSTNNSIFVNKTGASGNILTLQKNGSGVFTIANSGAVTVSVSSSSAFNVTDGSLSYFNVDTSGALVRIGSATADGTGALLVLDTKNTNGDPTGVNGGQYYNSFTGKFRCYENGTWKDCISTTSVRSFIDTVSDAVVDANTTNYWDTGAENNNSTPNITLSQASGKSVLGILTFEVTATSNNDVEVSSRIERGIGSAPTCGSGTQVGGNPGIFSTNNGSIKSSTVTFVDNPNTTSPVYYVLCSDSTTNGTAANVTRIRVTLQEVNNSN